MPPPTPEFVPGIWSIWSTAAKIEVLLKIGDDPPGRDATRRRIPTASQHDARTAVP